MFCEKSVKTGPIYIYIYIYMYIKTREQAKSKRAKGIIKIDPPI